MNIFNGALENFPQLTSDVQFSAAVIVISVQYLLFMIASSESFDWLSTDNIIKE